MNKNIDNRRARRRVIVFRVSRWFFAVFWLLASFWSVNMVASMIYNGNIVWGIVLAIVVLWFGWKVAVNLERAVWGEGFEVRKRMIDSP